MDTKPKTIDEYLAPLPADQREALEQLRGTIRKAVPAAEECISYGLAAFRLNGKPLVGFGASRSHCALYLMSGSIVENQQELLKKYDTSKGTVRFEANKPLPATLVRKLLKARIAENDALAKAKG